jgi:hypothetical protein
MVATIFLRSGGFPTAEKQFDRAIESIWRLESASPLAFGAATGRGASEWATGPEFLLRGFAPRRFLHWMRFNAWRGYEQWHE